MTAPETRRGHRAFSSEGHAKVVRDGPFVGDVTRARERLGAAISEPEWEPTDDMRASQRRVFNYLDVDWTDDMVDRALWAMHREGLL